MTEMMKAVQLHAFGGPENLLYEETPGRQWAAMRFLCMCRRPALTRQTGICVTVIARFRLNGGRSPNFRSFWGLTYQASLLRSVKM